MKKLLEEVEKLSVEELTRANENFPQFASAHEGFAVILEEVQEHQEDNHKMIELLDSVFGHIRTNDIQHTNEFIKRLKESALHAAAGAIQVAAMCQKFINMVDKHD
jgi:Cys-tRNA synthase (O-phospho-L-seryl-tRNA:Cys-tRNA synthase)